MIQPIMHDPLFLAQKSAPATPKDAPVARDLLETLTAHADGCVGMAANMISVNKRIIAFDNEGTYMVMFNPEIVKKSGPYDAAAFPLLGFARPSGGSLSRCVGRMRSSRSVSKLSQDGRPRSSSTKSTTVRA